MNLNVRISVINSVLLLFCRYILHVTCYSYELPGETSPASVEMEVGDSVNISCRMNPKALPNRTVHDLYFIHALTHERVADSNIVIMNETTIVFMLRNAKEGKPIYRCMCGNDAIWETKVYVGHKPLEITNFTCGSYNYENMECNFTKPDNYVPTQYNVSFHLDLKAYKYFPKCVNEKFISCTAPHIGSVHANENIFHYKIVGTNSLGTITQYFDVDYMKVLILAAPGQNFSLRHVTANSATFTFRLKSSSKNLQWEVLLKPKNLSEIILSPETRPIPISSNEFELSLKNLSYAYYEYQIRLRVRLSMENRWSEPFTYWFRTLSRQPDRSPRTDVGAFEIDPSERKVLLYWEQLKPYEFNGPNFTYVVEQIGEAQSTTILAEMSSAGFSWSKDKQYEFSIRSKNRAGMSQSFTRIIIPAIISEGNKKQHTPPAVHNIHHESNKTFTLTWQSPPVVQDLIDYTVYWCRGKSYSLNSCEGSLHFQRVPRDIQKFTTAPQEDRLNLAVSANYRNFNTGMRWAECAMAEATDLIKMEPKVESTTATTIKVEWGLGNICPSIFEGYNLSYCVVAVTDSDKNDTDTYNCTNNEPEQYILIDKNFKRWELKDLKPYTHYKIEMFMYSERKFGRKSHPQIVQTLEAAPTPPLQLNVLHKSNTSATIAWMPPSEANGKIRFYTIVINNKSVKVPAAINVTYGRVVQVLENLSSSTTYKVHVIAQTGENLQSQPSSAINFTTFVGYPAMPGPVGLKDSTNDAEIEWVVPLGRTDFYEVAITLLKGEQVLSRRISIIVGANSCVFSIPKCFDHEYRTTVEVRSVNAALMKYEVDELTNGTDFLEDDDVEFYQDADDLSCIIKSSFDERQSSSFLQKQKETFERYNNPSVYRLYKSKWQLGPLFNCAASTFGTTIALYIFLATLFAVVFLMMIYFLRQKYNKMANINCTLPAALDAYMTKDFSGVSAVLSHNFIMSIKGNATNNQNGNILENFENRDVVITHSGSDSMVQNEEHCLLEATSQSSLFMSDQAHHEPPQSLLSSRLLEEKRFDVFKQRELALQNKTDNINPSHDIVSAAEKTGSNMQQTYVQASEIFNQNRNGEMPTLHNTYVKPNAITSWQNLNQNQTGNFNATSGYVSPDSIAAILPKALQNDTEIGYTNAVVKSNTNRNTQAINEPPQHSSSSQSKLPANNLTTTDSIGYTTVDQVIKMPKNTPVINTQDISNETLPTVAKPAISGYVTQQELTAYGHQQKQNLF